jgi:hypothetical protein
LLPILSELLQSAGPLCSTDITPLHRHYVPLRIPLAFRRFPGDSGYTASLLRRFLHGTRRVSPVAWHVIAIVLSLKPHQNEKPPRRSGCNDPCCLRPASEGSASGDKFSRPSLRSLSLRPDDSLTILKDGFVYRLQSFGFPTLCYSSYEAPDCYLGGSFSH